MEFLTEFNRKFDAKRQTAESQRLRNKYPNRLPILVDRRKDQAPVIDKNKYLVPAELSMAEFAMVIRKRLYAKNVLKPEQALFYFVGPKSNIQAPHTSLMSQIYQEYAENGYLTITYDVESAFGSDE